MGTTANFGLRYADSTDAPEIHTITQELAEDVDADLLTLQNAIAALESWTTYTPTLYNNAISGTPASIAKTVTRAGYWRIGTGAGSIIIAQAEVTASAAVANGAALTLPVAASERWLMAGTAGIYSPSPPTQAGHAYMASSLDRIVCVSYSNAFQSMASSDVFRYLTIYKAAS